MMSKPINLAALLQQATPSQGACMTRLARFPHLMAYGGPQGALRRIRMQGQEEALLRPSVAQPWVRTLVREAEAMTGCRLSAQQIAHLVTSEVGLLVSRFASMTLEFNPALQTLVIDHAGRKVSQIVLKPVSAQARNG